MTFIKFWHTYFISVCLHWCITSLFYTTKDSKFPIYFWLILSCKLIIGSELRNLSASTKWLKSHKLMWMETFIYSRGNIFFIISTQLQPFTFLLHLLSISEYYLYFMSGFKLLDTFERNIYLHKDHLPVASKTSFFKGDSQKNLGKSFSWNKGREVEKYFI